MTRQEYEKSIDLNKKLFESLLERIHYSLSSDERASIFRQLNVSLNIIHNNITETCKKNTREDKLLETISPFLNTNKDFIYNLIQGK